MVEKELLDKLYSKRRYCICYKEDIQDKKDIGFLNTYKLTKNSDSFAVSKKEFIVFKEPLDLNRFKVQRGYYNLIKYGNPVDKYITKRNKYGHKKETLNPEYLQCKSLRNNLYLKK